MNLMEAAIAAKLGGGGGGSVTPGTLIIVSGEMTDEQAAQFRDNIGAAPAETVVTVSGTTPTIEPTANTIYKCSELTSLTISNPPATGKFWIWFTSGATPTTTVGIANFAAEADKKYRITVEDGYATYDAWSVGGD